MTWKNAINIKLNLCDISRQIISDRTGILFSNEFISFLESSGISYNLSYSLEDLTKSSESAVIKIVITSVKDIPDYLSVKADIKKFALADLPINADVKALESITLPDILLLLNYLNATNLLQSINKDNIQTILNCAKQYKQSTYIDTLKIKIDEILLTIVNYDNILQLGCLYGELQFYIYKYSNDSIYSSLKHLQQRIDEYSFNYIIKGNLKNIFYESAAKVKSVSSIMPFFKSVSANKKALICFDCMGMSEWFLLNDYFKNLNISFCTNLSFSLIPSITSISRASIYYGSNTDVYKLSSVNETKALQHHFPDKNCKLFREKDDISSDSLLGFDVVSVIYNFFDDISHSIVFPANYESKAIYFEAVKNYLDNSTIINQIRILLDEGYKVFFCSDHGSVIAKGNGKKIDKYLQDKFAKRACLIDDSILAEFLDFPQMQIPFVEDKILVLPEGRTMFDYLNNVEISHGGITVDEIVVPFIEVIKC